MRTIKINKGQYLSEIIPLLLTNTIYFKILPGIGATTLEIVTERPSIIVEPNVPVIRGKKRKGILAVYEKIRIDDVVDYLQSKVRFKKILVTPESFYKVLLAAETLNINIYEDFFLLYDECDRTIKDVAFRPKLLNPMEVFFKFKNKAFISATAILPSDPRFIEQRFQEVYIEPTYKVEKPIELVGSNNVFLAIKEKLAQIDNDNICIFINSTNLIASIIKSLGLNQESVVYCSRESSHQLILSGIKNVYDNLHEFKRFNFFTSRFFSAVDINMDTKPSIIIATDLKSAVHTMIDPYCDTTQITGRFRKGFKEVIHITNFDSELKSMNKSEVMAYLSGCETSYNDIKALKHATLNQGSRDTLEAALKLVPYANFINEDGSKNYFMIDNKILEERVNRAYKLAPSFVKEYESFGYTPHYEELFYPLNDKSQLKAKVGISTLDVVKSVIEAIKISLDPHDDLYSLVSKREVLNELEKSHKIIVDGFRILGEEELIRSGYSKKAIKRAINTKLKNNDCSHFGFLRYLQSKIEDGHSYTTLSLKRIFDEGIKNHSLSIKPHVSIIKEIFNLGKRKTINGTHQKGYEVINCRLNRQD